MKLLLTSLIFICGLLLSEPAKSQAQSIDRAQFFADTSMVNATLVTRMSKVLSHYGKKGVIFPGNFITTLPNGTQVNDPVLLEIRGHFRLGECYLPPIKLIFDADDHAVLHSLKSLKLVSECKTSNVYEQYLLKEYTAYKIFNLLTPISFRVRLLRLTFQDSAGKKAPIPEYAFLLEDIKDLAKRNDCKELKNMNVQTEATDRRQMTMVNIFEYMIGNTDWAVSVNHNIKLIQSATDSLKKRPIAVPYDFDFSGLVNTDYSAPDERLQIETVRERLYRGYPRTMLELEDVLQIYKDQKSNIYALVNGFNLLTPNTKKEMVEYLDEFYKTIESPDLVKKIFIDAARTE
jgi:hypothetical protein